MKPYTVASVPPPFLSALCFLQRAFCSGSEFLVCSWNGKSSSPLPQAFVFLNSTPLIF